MLEMSNQGDSKEENSGVDKKMDSGGARKARSRSRSWDRDHDRDRSQRFGKNFTNSNDPHMKRARLFIGDLNTRTGDLRKRDLENFFSRYGRVSGISIHSGYAFVQMDRERSANKAIHYAHGRLVNGNKIRVEFSSAALDAGAKFRPLSPSEREELEASSSSSSLYGGRMGSSSSSDLYDTFRRDPLALLEIERMERERLERLLRIERELHARGRDEMDKMYDPLGSSSRSKYGASGDSWRDLDYGRPRRDYSPPTYGGSSRHGRETSPYHYGMREKSSPSRYGGYSDSSSSNYPPVGYHPVDKSVASRDSYSNTYGSGTGYSGRSAGRSQMSTGYGRDTRNTSSAWGNGNNQTYGLMGDSPGWK